MYERRSLPHSEDAEKALLCCLQLDPDVMRQCEGMPERAWYIPAHRILYNTFVEFRKEGKPLDFYLVKDHLKAQNLLEEIGGKEELSHIWGFVPCADNWRYYLNLVTQYHTRRETIWACELIREKAFDLSTDISECRMAISI